ncbi:DisA checkpoint controller nucleotide-binding [Natronoarchaeum philippinense]|uniref:Diadenylate cyclase n=1 Tax=Natronoarchaeum philippinense TaxID=558529 RepID=A0A285N4Y9_NATPI|nr:diadenylate cyclase DacZ [Natronoarchaeum philippinense]SNZ04003.1 DisA checkpoint controller nucleotide-binding [Natronoarchaeum philippinense]
MSDLRELFGDLFDGVDGIVLFSPSSSYYERFDDIDDDIDVMLVGPENDHDADAYVELPVAFENPADRIEFAIEGAIDEGLVDEGDELLCALSLFEDDADSLTRVRANPSEGSGVYDLFVNSRAEPDVIRAVFELAVELGQKGQKGKPVGALFVVGDAGKVMNKSRPLSYNPFEKSHVHVGDPIVKVMLKEFSRLDGAFVISDAGKIVSAYRYLEPAAEGVDIPKGLGARHMAAGAITRDTNATAIVLSESDGLVRAFKGGEMVLEVDPENY